MKKRVHKGNKKTNRNEKRRIDVKKRDNKLHFYLWTKGQGEEWLFTDPYSKGLYAYFENGRSEKEIREYCNWDKNPRVDKTISKLSKRLDAMQKEDQEDIKEYKMIQLYIPALEGFKLRQESA